MRLPEFLKSSEAYKETYVRGLVRLKHLFNDPASRVLVAACDSYSADWRHFSDEELQASLRWCRQEFAKLQEFDPTMRMLGVDQTIIDKLLSPEGSKFLTPVMEREVGDFSVVYTSFRDLRPVGPGIEKMTRRYVEYNPAEEALFTKDFIQKDRLWVGEIIGVPVSFFYNKFPNLLGHAVIVPWPEQRLFQEMTKELHDWTWEITETIGGYIPDVAIAYNSIGGGATQKHLHTQFTIKNPFPVTTAVWQHNGGRKKYPATVMVADDREEAWRTIDACLSDDQTAYGLLYVPGKLYNLPEPLQGYCEIPWWGTGIGLGDKAGRITVSSREAYDKVTEEEIAHFLGQWSR